MSKQPEYDTQDARVARLRAAGVPFFASVDELIAALSALPPEVRTKPVYYWGNDGAYLPTLIGCDVDSAHVAIDTTLGPQKCCCGHDDPTHEH